MAQKTPASQLERLSAAIKLQVENINPGIFQKVKDLTAKLLDHDKDYKHHDIEKNSLARHPKEHKHSDLARKKHTHPEYKNKDVSKQLNAQDKAMAIINTEMANLKTKPEIVAPISIPTSGWEFTINRLSSGLIHTIDAKRISK